MDQNEKKSGKLLSGAILMGLIILLSKAAGLVRDILIAGAYGSTAVAQAYETASKLPITVFDFILGGVVTSAFIPVYNRLRVQKSKKDAVSFAQSYFNFILLITVSVAVLGVVFAPQLVTLIAPELAHETAEMAADLTRIMFPMVIFVGAAFTFVGFLQSEGEFNLPAVISLVSNALMIFYLIFLNDKFGVTGLSIAMLIGWALQAAVQLPSAIKRGFRFKLNASIRTPEIGESARATLPILIASWTTPVCAIINNRVASGIEGGRAINALGYANRLYIIIVGIFSFVATNLLFPMIAKAQAAGDTEERNKLTKSSVKALVFIIAPIAVGVAALSGDFVSIIYERGSFTASDTALTASALSAYAVGMVFAALYEVLSKMFFAVEKPKIPMISSIIALAFNGAVVLFFGDSLTVGTVALVVSLTTAVNMIVAAAVAMKMGFLELQLRDWGDIVKSLISALLMGAAVLWVFSLTESLGTLLSFALSVIAGVAVYLILSIILRSDQLKVVFDILKRRPHD